MQGLPLNVRRPMLTHGDSYYCSNAFLSALFRETRLHRPDSGDSKTLALHPQIRAYIVYTRLCQRHQVCSFVRVLVLHWKHLHLQIYLLICACVRACVRVCVLFQLVYSTPRIGPTPKCHYYRAPYQHRLPGIFICLVFSDLHAFRSMFI